MTSTRTRTGNTMDRPHVIHERLGAESDYEYSFCSKCHSEVDWQDCDRCEDGFSYHDCGEDSCCCLYPENNVTCNNCEGRGGWYECIDCGWLLSEPENAEASCASPTSEEADISTEDSL